MRIAVTGDRKSQATISVEAVLNGYLKQNPDGFMLIHGGSSGIDAIANAWAWGERVRGKKLYLHSWPPEWEVWGTKRAEEMRNEQILADKPDILIVFPRGGPASDLMVEKAAKAGIAIDRVTDEQLAAYVSERILTKAPTAQEAPRPK